MTKDIFIDTDCISAFLWTNNESLLSKLYPNGIVMPKPVYEEIDRPSLYWMKERVDKMIELGHLLVFDINYETEEFWLYYKLTQKPDKGHKIIGNGEASSIALAKVYNGIVASNNFRDIISYINEYSLDHITTGDILVKAFEMGLIDEDEGNNIWNNMLKKRRKIGAESFSKYLNSSQSQQLKAIESSKESVVDGKLGYTIQHQEE